MDLAHLRYAVEIARTQSISQAAENLYMGQPNLSRAIKELEEELQIQIFRRTSHGVSVTTEGEEFLRHARSIVLQTSEIEEIYKNKKLPKQQFSLCAPRASYISEAFTNFVQLATVQRPQAEPFEFNYKETNSMKAIRKVLDNEYNLAIIRYQSTFDKYFRQLFNEKKLCAETVAEFPLYITLSQKNPLTEKELLITADLHQGIEILHSDPYVPSLPTADILKAEAPTSVSRKIYIFERSTQFTLLEQIPNAFMWNSKIPQEILQKYGLTQKPCAEQRPLHKDMLIYRKGYKLSELDNIFVTELCQAKRHYLD